MSYPPPPGAGAPGGYPPPGGFQGGYPPPQAQQTNGMAIASLVVGIIGILSCIAGPLFGLIAVVLGVIALGKAKQLNGSGKGLAIGGIVTGIIGILSGIVFFFIFFVAADAANDVVDDAVCQSQESALEIAVSAYQARGQGDPSSQQDLVDAGLLTSEIEEYDFSISNGVVTTTAVDGQGCE